MGKRMSILKNTLSLWVPEVLNPFVSFALVLVISRYLGVKGFGQYSLVFSYVGMFSGFATLGLEDLITREVARRPDDVHVYFVNATLFGTFASSVSLLAMNALVCVMGYERDVVEASFTFSFSIVVSSGILYLHSIFRSIEKAEYAAVTYVLENIVKIGVCILLLLMGYGIVALFAAILGCRVFAFVLMLTFYVSVLGRPRLEIRWDVLKRLGREVPTFAGIAVSYAIYLNVDQIMLSKLMGIEAVGLYGSAKRLVQILKTLPLSFSAALLPFFTREYATGRQALANLCANSVRYVFLAVMPIVMGTVILADSMITLIFGNKFAAAGNLLRGQILVLIPFGMVYIFSDVLLATNNQKVVMKVLAVCAAVNFVLNLLLIPFFDEMGAVLATLTTIVIFNELQRLYVRRHLFAIPLLPSVIKALGAAICMGLVTYLLKQSNIFLNVIISTVVYLTLVITVRGVSWEEVQLIGRIITLRRKREDG